MIKYGKASISDITTLTHLRVSYLDEIKPISDIEREIMYREVEKFLYEGMTVGSFFALAAKYNGTVIATSGLSVYFLPPTVSCLDGKSGCISNMYTMPQFRRQGIASKLFSLTMDEARKQGCSRVYLNATDMGRPIYEKYGFRDYDREMVFQFNGDYE